MARPTWARLALHCERLRLPLVAATAGTIIAVNAEITAIITSSSGRVKAASQILAFSSTGADRFGLVLVIRLLRAGRTGEQRQLGEIGLGDKRKALNEGILPFIAGRTGIGAAHDGDGKEPLIEDSPQINLARRCSGANGDDFGPLIGNFCG